MKEAKQRKFRAWPIAVWADADQLGCLYPPGKEYYGLNPMERLRVPPECENDDFTLHGPAGLTELCVIVALAEKNPFEGVHRKAGLKPGEAEEGYANWLAAFAPKLRTRLNDLLKTNQYVVQARLSFHVVKNAQ